METELIFTPGQREEALDWIKANCLPLYEYARDMGSGEDRMIDMYFKLKTIDFQFRPEEFVIGIEYTDKDKVIAGTDQVNIRFQNPHKLGKGDQFAQQVAIELLQRLKG